MGRKTQGSAEGVACRRHNASLWKSPHNTILFLFLFLFSFIYHWQKWKRLSRYIVAEYTRGTVLIIVTSYGIKCLSYKVHVYLCILFPLRLLAAGLMQRLGHGKDLRNRGVIYVYVYKSRQILLLGENPSLHHHATIVFFLNNYT